MEREELRKVISDNLHTTENNSELARKLIKDFKLEESFEAVRVLISRARNKKTPKEVVKKIQAKRTTEEKPFILSAWSNKGYMMNIDEYCEAYKLPRKDIKRYKLISHTGTPYYNIEFKDTVELDTESIEDIINRLTNYNPEYKEVEIPQSEIVDRLIFSDVHIGMDASRGGLAQYSSEWGIDELVNRVQYMVKTVIENKKSDTIIVDELGDYLDGLNAETVRGGHKLPQNMTNEEAFDWGVQMKLDVASKLSQVYDMVIFNNICEDNHAGSFGYFVNSAFKGIADSSYNNVYINNYQKFINHYTIGKHAFVISHGKDSRNLKFGFSVHLDAKQIEKIDQYLKQNGVYKEADFIEFTKGDSHQFLYDACSSDDFEYLNVMAFSPSSEWVQTNFKKGRSGFVLQHVHTEINRKDTTPFWF